MCIFYQKSKCKKKEIKEQIEKMQMHCDFTNTYTYCTHKYTYKNISFPIIAYNNNFVEMD